MKHRKRTRTSIQTNTMIDPVPVTATVIAPTKQLDPDALDWSLAALIVNEEHWPYLEDAITLATTSKIYHLLEETIYEKEKLDTTRMKYMFAFGLICGGACSLAAFDNGYIRFDESYNDFDFDDFDNRGN